MTKKINKVKFGVIIAFSFLFVLLFVLPNINLSLIKAFSREMPSILILDDKTEFAGDKGKTPFDHDQHISTRANTTCVTCHHTNSNKLSIAIEEDVPKCNSCHKDSETPSTFKGTNESKDFLGKMAMTSEEAFHGRGSDIGCIGCHSNRGIEPIGCGDCHTKKDTVDYVIKPLFPEVKDKLKPVMPSTSLDKATKPETNSDTKEKATNSKELEEKAIENTKSEAKAEIKKETEIKAPENKDQ